MVKNKSHKGYTLVELIVVLVITSVLAAIAVPRVNSFVNDAKGARRASNFDTTYIAVVSGLTEAFVDEYNFPEDDFYIAVDETKSKNTLLEAYVKKVLPEEHKISLNEAIVLDDNDNVFKNVNGDNDSKTWGVFITLNKIGKLDKIYISNGDYYSINANKPIKFSK